MGTKEKGGFRREYRNSKHVYLTDDQDRMLKHLCEKYKLSYSNMIRFLIEAKYYDIFELLKPNICDHK